MSILCIWLQVINEVKVTHQGEGHIKVKVKYLHPFKFYVAHTFCKQVVCIQLNAFLFLLALQKVSFSFEFIEISKSNLSHLPDLAKYEVQFLGMITV